MQPTLFQDKLTCRGGAATWTFNDVTALPAGVTQLGANILDGWDNTAPVEVLATSRGTRDGDVPADHFPLRSRVMMLSGWMYATTRTTARQAFTAMCRDAFPANVDLTLTRFEPDAAKQVTVRRAGPVEVPPLTNVTGPHYRFLIPLRAFDPLKYATVADINATTGVAGVSNGGVVVPVLVPVKFVAAAGQINQITATNAGSYDTKPVATITGPLPAGWHWDNSTTGESLALAVGLGSGDSLVLDHAAETATLNGYPIAPGITGDWWPIVPGPVQVLRLFGDYNVAATVTVVGRSAWE